MGIGIHLSEIILREHLHKPLPPEVFTIGRAFMGYTYEDALDIFKRVGCTPQQVEVTYDQQTMEARQRESTGTKFITADTFFGMIGVNKVRVIDINPYEEADILLDLTKPLPDEFAGTSEFVVGASVLDNIFDPAQYIKNLARFLAPGGRLVEINIFVNKMRPYMLVPAAWFLDYFVVNRFDRCDIFVLEYSTAAHLYELRVPFNPNQKATWAQTENFEFDADSTICHVVIAEKGNTATWSESPVQDAYRSQAEVDDFNRNLRKILDSPRLNVGLRPWGPRPVNEERNKIYYGYLGCFEK